MTENNFLQRHRYLGAAGISIHSWMGEIIMNLKVLATALFLSILGHSAGALQIYYDHEQRLCLVWYLANISSCNFSLLGYRQHRCELYIQ